MKCYGVAVYQSDDLCHGLHGRRPWPAPVSAALLRTFSISRITALGVVLWTAQLGSAAADEGLGIAVDGSGVYVTGYTIGSLSGQPFAGGSSDAFVARYTHAGAWDWTRMLGTSSDEYGDSVALDRRQQRARHRRTPMAR
jgi:hypothetical protein